MKNSHRTTKQRFDLFDLTCPFVERISSHRVATIQSSAILFNSNVTTRRHDEAVTLITRCVPTTSKTAHEAESQRKWKLQPFLPFLPANREHRRSTPSRRLAPRTAPTNCELYRTLRAHNVAILRQPTISMGHATIGITSDGTHTFKGGSMHWLVHPRPPARHGEANAETLDRSRSSIMSRIPCSTGIFPLSCVDHTRDIVHTTVLFAFVSHFDQSLDRLLYELKDAVPIARINVTLWYPCRGLELF